MTSPASSGKTIHQVRAFTQKRCYFRDCCRAETGQPAKIRNLFAGMRKYQTLGLVCSTWLNVQGSVIRIGASKTIRREGQPFA